jgi:starch phosphorylase
LTVLPERINRLEALARDLWWSWTPPARQVFRQLDYALWRMTAHNPVRMLQLVTLETLERAMSNPEWLTTYDAAVARLEAVRNSRLTWCHREHPELSSRQIA